MAIRTRYRNIDERGDHGWHHFSTSFPYAEGIDGQRDMTLLSGDQIDHTPEKSFQLLKRVVGDSKNGSILLEEDISVLEPIEKNAGWGWYNRIAHRSALQAVLNEIGIKVKVPDANQSVSTDTPANVADEQMRRSIPYASRGAAWTRQRRGHGRRTHSRY